MIAIAKFNKLEEIHPDTTKYNIVPSSTRADEMRENDIILLPSNQASKKFRKKRYLLVSRKQSRRKVVLLT